MRQICRFDKNRDIKPVKPSMATDIAKAIETGEVLDSATADEYNKYDVDDIGERVRDNFDAVAAGNRLSYNSDVTSSVNPTGVSD